MNPAIAVGAWAVGSPADRVFAHGCWVSFDRTDPRALRRGAAIGWAGPLAQGRYQPIPPEQIGDRVGHRVVGRLAPAPAVVSMSASARPRAGGPIGSSPCTGRPSAPSPMRCSTGAS